VTGRAAPALAPRLLSKSEAAAYCGLGVRGFENWVAKGLVPGAVPGTARWDRKAIDAALDKASGISGCDEGESQERSPLDTWLMRRNNEAPARSR